MKIFLNIEADSPAELDQAIHGLQEAIGGVTGVSANMVDPPAEQKTVASTESAAPEPEKRTRAKKADAAPKAEAMKEEPKVEAAAPAKEEAKPADKPKDLTADEVKNYVIDYLNDWSKASPDDPEIRRKKLMPILEKFGGEKLTVMLASMDVADYPKVIAMVDEGREDMPVVSAED